MICVLLKAAGSAVFSTETRPWASGICWDEFYIDQVASNEELTFSCVNRARNELHACPLPQEEANSCPGFLGKVCVPLARLPEGEEVEQWYPLVPKESSLALRTALRVLLCFVPNGTAFVRTPSAERRRVTPTSVLPPSPANEISSASPVAKRLQMTLPSSLDTTDDVAIPLEMGIVDYVIVVGAAFGNDHQTSLDESQVRFRYPLIDRQGFPLPTKIEWFCFPDGPEIVVQAERPRSKVFSFVLVGGDDGLCRCYVVCLVVYHRSLAPQQQDPPKTQEEGEKVWYATCVALLTRIPVMEEATACLLGVARAWLAADSRRSNDSDGGEGTTKVLKHLANLCHDIVLPIRGVFGVQFAIDNLKIRLVVPSNTSIYTARDPERPELRRLSSTQGGQISPLKSSSRSFIAIQQGFQPLVYSLEPIFQLFDIKTIIHLVTLVLCEYRILIHSSQQSLLCPVAEGLCALIYPFRWQHPYVPILPRVLSEYLQAPLPYILGIDSSWLQGMLEGGRPEHLVIVDVDRGTIQLQEAGGPVLPHKLTTGLHRRLKAILHPSLYEDNGVDGLDWGSSFDGDRNSDFADLFRDYQRGEERRGVVEWRDGTEKRVRTEFACFLAAVVRGYRECLFFVNQSLPVFNKRRFFESDTTDSEVVPLVTRVFCTQAFQTFLETHSSAELSVFHSTYLTLCRGSKDSQWPSGMRSPSVSQNQNAMKDTEATRIHTPVLVMTASDNRKAAGVDGNGEHVTIPDDVVISVDEEETIRSLGEKIETLLDEEGEIKRDPFALETGELQALSMAPQRHVTPLNHHQLAQQIGVESKVLKANAHLLRNAHQVNQYRLLLGNLAGFPLAGSAGVGSSSRLLSSEDERIEQMLHKCLTAVFTSDDTLVEDEIRPNNQYVESKSGSPMAGGTRSSSTWYNPKGSGNCIGSAGFRLLARLASALMNQCAVHEDFTDARGILQVASQYYHYVEDKHSGIGFAKKEYLVTPLRLLPICRSLDLWQHAFSCEIEAANQADPTESDEEARDAVSDELFFSVIGSLMYDMLSFEVPLPKVLTFVAVMCSTYQKGRDLLDTLKQLAENVYRALDLSKDIKPSPPKEAMQSRTSDRSTAFSRPDVPSTSSNPVQTADKTTGSSSSAVAFAESPVLSREYDLDTVIRRKMSVRDVKQHPREAHCPGPIDKDEDTQEQNGNPHQHTDWMSRTPPTRRRQSSVAFPNAVLATSGSPVLSLVTDGGRAACGLADARINVIDTEPIDDEKGVRLEGHTSAVVAVQMRGNTLISGSRDHTLRSWDLRATPKKRHMFAFFSLSYGTSNTTALIGEGSCEVDGASVSKRSLVLRGHSAAVTCMELGRQLGSTRALVASGSDDGTVRLWETTRESSVAVLDGDKGTTTTSPATNGGVSCLRFLASDDDLAVGCRCRSLQIWDLAAGKMKVKVEAHRAGVRDLQVSGTRLVTAANDRVVKVWDAAFRSGSGTQQYVQALRDHGGPIHCVSLGGPADPNICTGAGDGLVRLWDLRYVQRGPRLTLRGHVGPVTRLQRDFTKLVSAGEDGWLRVWDMHSGVCLREKQVHRSGVTCLEMRDSLVYSGSWDGSVCVSHSSTFDSSDSSSEDETSHGQSTCTSIQRGVFEYLPGRESVHTINHDGGSTLLPPHSQRPRRLHVQALPHSGGGVLGTRSFDFDYVFPPWKKQREVYDECVQVQIQHVLQTQQHGRPQHATIVAYGQTGTGKTYTMGMLSDFTDHIEQGLIPRALTQILEFASSSNAKETTVDAPQLYVTMSFLQIYLETVQDLLILPASEGGDLKLRRSRGDHVPRSGRSCSGDLPVRQGQDGGFHVAGLSEYDIHCMEDVHALLALATRNRVLAATARNKTSSRSHTLLTISLQRRRRRPDSGRSGSEDEEDDDEAEQRVSTISFVDLAGSERVDGALHFLRATRARQELRIREAKFINRSLSALGGVIAALAQPKARHEQTSASVASAHVLARLNASLQGTPQFPAASKQQQHIRFRDSQLTKLLQGRLMAGRGRLLLIATVDDQTANLAETLSTLKFAAQCRRVELQRAPGLREARAARLRRQQDQSLLDQVFKDMKTMHEDREAALHVRCSLYRHLYLVYGCGTDLLCDFQREYQARIEALGRKLEAARSSSTAQDAAAMHLASYTALCSLADEAARSSAFAGECRLEHHPRIGDFRSEADMIQYVSGLYHQLKAELATKQSRQEESKRAFSTPVESSGPAEPRETTSPAASVAHEGKQVEKSHGKQLEPSTTEAKARKPSNSGNRPPSARSDDSIHWSEEQEAEFRVIARHLLATHALDTLVLSSSDEETTPFSQIDGH
ncbi:hypothetical protein BBJ28_00006682 [Nothophytophthora sp. Chile5]|nr:hypothetical protein BBJ28_00006682 [Nothophytophthora sp. Chile5]